MGLRPRAKEMLCPHDQRAVADLPRVGRRPGKLSSLGMTRVAQACAISVSSGRPSPMIGLGCHLDHGRTGTAPDCFLRDRTNRTILRWAADWPEGRPAHA